MPMGRMYAGVLDAQSVSTAVDLVYLKAAADLIIVVHEIIVSQDTSETSQQLPLQILRRTTDNSGGATTPAPSVINPSDTAFSSTWETYDGSWAGTGSAGDILWRASQNVLNGWHYLPTPELRPILSPGGRIAVALETNPASALIFTVTMYFEEIGG